jgi:integrase/recombinase XerD
MNKALEPIRNAEVTIPFGVDILAGTLTQSSQAVYKRDFAAYVRYAGNAWQDVTTFARWRTALSQDSREYSPNTINRMLSAVKRLMREAASQGYVTHELAESFEQVPGVMVKAMKSRLRPHNRTRIAPIDMRKLSNAPGTDTLVGLRDTALLLTLASSGLRASELASLTQGQIRETDKGYLLSILGKNETEYEDAPLSREAYEAIQTWLNARKVVSAFIFTSFAGRGDGRLTHEPMTSVAVWQTITKYAQQVGLDNVKPHDLRRFLGTNLAKQDIRKAQKALRHKSIETTARHYVLDDLEAGLTDNLF